MMAWHAVCSTCRGVGAEQCSETDAEIARRYACMPGSLERALAAFQREGVRFAIARRGRALLGDEMGALSRSISRFLALILGSQSNQ